MKAATLDGVKAGLIMLRDLGRGMGYVYYVAVLPEFRRRKVGGRMLDDALAYFSSRRVSPVFTTVKEDNTPSLSLFLSRGFVKTSFGEMSNSLGRLGALFAMFEMQAVAGEVVMRKDAPGAKRKAP